VALSITRLLSSKVFPIEVRSEWNSGQLTRNCYTCFPDYRFCSIVKKAVLATCRKALEMRRCLSEGKEALQVTQLTLLEQMDFESLGRSITTSLISSLDSFPCNCVFTLFRKENKHLANQVVVAVVMHTLCFRNAIKKSCPGHRWSRVISTRR
jgi:hypothetical protein